MKKLSAGEINALSEKIHRELNPQLSPQLREEAIAYFEDKYSKFMETTDGQILAKYNLLNHVSSKKEIYPDLEKGGFKFSRVYSNTPVKTIGLNLGTIYVYSTNPVVPVSIKDIKREVTVAQIGTPESVEQLIRIVKQNLGL